MPIRQIIKNDRSFTPEDNVILVAAFEDTLKTLNLIDREDPITTLVAQKIVEVAKKGERDPERLRVSALTSLGVERPY
jgi:hypothetical protein